MKSKFSILSLYSASGLMFMPSLLSSTPNPDDNDSTDPIAQCLNAKGSPQ